MPRYVRFLTMSPIGAAPPRTFITEGFVLWRPLRERACGKAGMDSDRARRVTRRGFLMTAGGVAGAGSLAYVVGRGVTYSGSARAVPRSAPGGQGGLNAYAANVIPGGPGKDGIPAIGRPRFTPAGPGLL